MRFFSGYCGGETRGFMELLKCWDTPIWGASFFFWGDGAFGTFYSAPDRSFGRQDVEVMNCPKAVYIASSRLLEPRKPELGW